MAVRLNVIMVHSPPATATAQRVAESVVGELIGRPGIDMTLVGPLDQIRDGSTDRLTLDSITTDAAVLDWRTADELINTLNSIGFSGSRWPHRHDGEATGLPAGGEPPGASRKIFAYNLNNFDEAKDLCTALMDLLATRQVTTYSLGIASSGSAKPTTPAPSVPNRPAVIETTLAKTTAAPSPLETSVKQPAEIDLDQLVDQLDEFDP